MRFRDDDSITALLNAGKLRSQWNSSGMEDCISDCGSVQSAENVLKSLVTMRAARILLIVLIGIIPVLLSANEMEEPASYQSGRGGMMSPPVVLPLSRILQLREQISPEATWAPEEEEEIYVNENTPPEEGPVRFLPHHSFQEDRIDRDPDSIQATATASPVLLKKFSGIGETGRGNLDTILAVGPSHVMAAVNPNVAIYTKKGRLRFEAHFRVWFASLKVARGAHLFDPKLVYDQYSGHFIFLCDARTQARSFFLISVSKTSDPEGEWAFWALDMQQNGTERVNFWADLPRIGFDQDAVYLSGGMYTFGVYQFQYAKIRVLKKSELYAFKKLGWYDFWGMNERPRTKAINIEPAHAYGTTDAGYFLSINPSRGSRLTLWKVINPTAETPILRRKRIAVSTYSAAPAAEQKGGGAVINRGCACVINAVLKNGSLYTAFSTAHDWGAGNVAALRFYQVSTSGDLIQEITYGAKTSYYLFPSVMADSSENIAIVFNRTGPREFIGSFYTGRGATDSPGTLRKSSALQMGLSNYQDVFSGSNITHWGDYSGIALDQDDTIWIYGEYARGSKERGTIIGQLDF